MKNRIIIISIVIFFVVAGLIFEREIANTLKGASVFALKETVKAENQRTVFVAPETIKAIYLTGNSAGNKNKIDYAIELAKTGAINAVVIDIKDYSGYVFYDTKVQKVVKYGAKKIKISNIDSLLEKLHSQGIYAIARIVVFQDPVLAKARQDLAIYSKNNNYNSSSKLELDKNSFSFSQLLMATVSLWLDNSRLAWIDPSSEEVWDYNIAIAKEAASRGFDEINFDYIRFPSDGDLKNMVFPFWDGKIAKSEVIERFFQKIRKEIPDSKLSVDIFGLTTVDYYSDMGIGQVLEKTFGSFDYVCPMVYPSHYAKGFLGFLNPAEYPYEVVKNSMETAQNRLDAYKKANETNNKKIKAKLRPWLQDFNLGAIYDTKMVKYEIQAVKDALGKNFNGFMLWNASNFYNKEALKSEISF